QARQSQGGKEGQRAREIPELGSVPRRTIADSEGGSSATRPTLTWRPPFLLTVRGQSMGPTSCGVLENRGKRRVRRKPPKTWRGVREAVEGDPFFDGDPPSRSCPSPGTESLPRVHRLAPKPVRILKAKSSLPVQTCERPPCARRRGAARL